MAIINLTVKETGITEAQRKINYFLMRFPKDTAAAVKKEGELTMTESKLEVPVDTGALRNSGFVEQPKITNNNISVKLGYGGVATKINPKTKELTTQYAIKVHEDLFVHHRIGKAKFLEDPIKRRRYNILSNINSSVERTLRESGFK
jgi:hypothetical protein